VGDFASDMPYGELVPERFAGAADAPAVSGELVRHSRHGGKRRCSYW
jgi:hypothetical protein